MTPFCHGSIFDQVYKLVKDKMQVNWGVKLHSLTNYNH